MLVLVLGFAATQRRLSTSAIQRVWPFEPQRLS
jgi:hypothetical protein